jgi:hypothetical protein
MAPLLLTFSSVADAATGGPVCRRLATLASGAALRQQPDAGADARVTKDRNPRNATPQPHNSASPAGMRPFRVTRQCQPPNGLRPPTEIAAAHAAEAPA